MSVGKSNKFKFHFNKLSLSIISSHSSIASQLYEIFNTTKKKKKDNQIQRQKKIYYFIPYLKRNFNN